MTSKKPSIRTFMTLTISLIVTVILLCSISFFYLHTSRILRENSQESIVTQLSQVNSLITEQIESIDSVIPLFLSNNLILDALESGSAELRTNTQFQVERQMSYIYTSTPLSNKNYTNSIYLLRDDETVFHTYTCGTLEDVSRQSQQLMSAIDKTNTGLLCFMLPEYPQCIYFARNLFNSNTGNHMGIMVLNINSDKFMAYCSKNLAPSWFITLYNPALQLNSDDAFSTEGSSLRETLSWSERSIAFQELSLNGKTYYAAAEKLSELDLTSAVAAPRDLLLQDLNSTLKSYLILLIATIFLALTAAIIISRTVTRPIQKMVGQINEISSGSRTTLPEQKLYQEFALWADSFNDMLAKLDASYNDNFQKQLLLKNAEIQALQSQMNPHFIFNVLNTIAWKAQMIDNEEIYQMVISLGELLRMDILSKNHSFVTLAQEMEYVKLYMYLQQMRFEDKISCSIQINPALMDYYIPGFSVQPLVENAIIHGLEPKKGKGRLEIQILETDQHQLEINILDDGVGFAQIPDKNPGGHTHIGLRNLDKRLTLLFGEESHLKIERILNEYTSVSFTIPVRKEPVP